MKNTKRIIATVLTAVMMISMLPSSVFAAELDAYDVVEPAVEAVSVPAEEQEIESTVEDISVEDAEEVQGSSEEIETVDAADPEAADVIEDTEAPVVGAENFPAQDFEGKTDSVTVKVHAPEGALPVGTELKVEEVKKEDVENLVGEGTEDFVAVDISFHVDGQEEDFEPLAAVEVEFILEKDVLPQTENYDVIHVAVDEKGEETPEVIEEKNIIDEITKDGGKISQKDFSVFIIAAAPASSDDDTQTEKAVETYEFYVDDERIDDYTQAVKKGDTLTAPPTPEDIPENKVFDAWVENLGTENEKAVEFGKTIEKVDPSESVHRVDAKLADAYYVTFYDADGTTIVDVKKDKEGESVTTDVKIETTDVAKTHAGWATTQGAAEAEYSLADSITLAAEDVSLYPVFVEGYTLTFNGNDGGTDEASYTAPEYLAPSENTVKPEDPTRKGYTFGGWYADEECTTEFSFGSPIAKDTTVWAKWDNGSTEFTVVIWRQKVTDKVGMADSEKSYDYYKEFKVAGNTGETYGASGTDADGNTYDYTSLAPNPDSETDEYKGFVYRTSDEIEVDGNGKSIVNVFYDRKLVNYRFSSSTDIYYYVGPDYDGDEPTYSYTDDEWPTAYYRGTSGPLARTDRTRYYVSPTGQTDTRYHLGWYEKEYRYAHCNYQRISILGLFNVYIDLPLVHYANQLAHYYRYENQSGWNADGDGEYIKIDGHSISGLYGSSFEQNGYVWPSGEWYYYGPGKTYMSVLSTFLPQWGAIESNPYDVQFYNDTEEADVSARPIYFYTEGADGKYRVANVGVLRNSENSTIFNFTQKYDTHKLYAYVVGDLGTIDDEATHEGFSPESLEGVQYFDYTGEAFTPTQVDIKSQSEGGYETSETLHVFFKRKDFTITYDNCVDANGNDIVTSYLYGADIVAPSTVYYPEETERQYYEFAGWYADPQFTQPVAIGEGEYATMPFYNLVFYAKWNRSNAKVTLDANGGKFDDDSVTKEEAVSYDDSFNATGYVPTRDGYTFVGWVKGAETGTPWTATEAVTKDTTLVAKWRSNASLKLAYYNGDTLVETDPDSYRDQACAEVTHTKVSSEGKYFQGWSETNGSETADYKAGQLYKLDAANAVEGTIKLYAVFTTFEIPTVELKIYPNKESATLTEGSQSATGVADDQYLAYEGKKNTVLIDLNTITAACEGFKLLGYATTSDGDVVFETTDKVAADENAPNALYAVWEEKQKFYVYHSFSDKTDTFYVEDYADGFNIVAETDSDHLYGGYYKYSESEGVAQKGTAYTESGFSVTPVAGTTYYLKEVDTRYLKPTVYRIYRTASPQVLRDMYLMTALDDDVTSSIYGFIMDDNDAIATGKAETITVTKANRGNTVINTTRPDVCGLAGSVAYLNLKDYVDDSKYETKWEWDQSINLQAFYVTADNVKVTGTQKRSVTFKPENALGKNWLTRTSMEISDIYEVAAKTEAYTAKKSKAVYSRRTYVINASKALELAVTKVDNGKKVIQNVNEGNNTGKITYSGKAKYVFAGWYEDASYTKAADFSNVTKDMTVYAKYVKASDVKLSFAKKSVKGGKVTLKATLKINNQPNVTDAAVECNYNDKAYDVTFTGVKATKSGSATVNTFSGTVTIGSLANNDTFKAAISYTTPDGTLVSLESKTCKYNAGLVTVK